AGSSEVLEVGDLSVEKEYGFAGDIVEAIWTLVSQNKVFEAVIGTGVSYSIKAWIQTCFQLKNLDWHKYVVVKENFLPEYKILVSDPSTINSLGWFAKTSISDLAGLMLDSK
ncbi:MAG: GDP-mannose 4,6-dehydratase, partial [Chitinophagaceae bacterium]|nr:GDP-mannose 4,6-dehydratase [Chitinophagaceae bacterium]